MVHTIVLERDYFVCMCVKEREFPSALLHYNKNVNVE
jgi:hypothetical protein